MNVVDSSGWLEYFADGPNAEFFSGPIQDLENLLVPTLSFYEVFKRVIVQRSEGDALQAVAAMQQGRVVDLTSHLAIIAARLSIDLGLPMADSVLLAAARAHEATFWTQNSGFADIEGVRYIATRT